MQCLTSRLAWKPCALYFDSIAALPRFRTLHFRAPLFRLLVFLLLIAGTCLFVLYGALSRPASDIVLRGVDAEGRILAEIDGRAGELRGLLGAGAAPGTAIRLEPADFIEEPDMLPGYAAFDRFLERQGAITALMTGPRLAALLADDGGEHVVPVAVQPSRALDSLPAAFWVQLAAGFLTATIAAFFVALRPAHPPVVAFATAGFGVAGAAFSAAIYSTRHLGLDPALFTALSIVNQFSTFLFGVATIYLFAIYPTAVVRPARLWPVPAASLACLVLYRLQWAPHGLVAAQTVIVLMLVAIVALVAAQYRATRRDPAGRAVLLWLGLSVIIGAGVFVVFVALPVALGSEGLITQALGFIPLAAIYIGTALAIARFRLFDLGRWAYRVLLYTAMLALLFACDAALVMLFRLTPTASLAIAVAMAGIAYLPLRDFLFEKLFRSGTPDIADLYRRTVSVGLQPTAAARADAWIGTLKATFRPMHVERRETGAERPELLSDGEGLAIPAFAGLPAAELRFAEEGRRLFNPRDAALAGELARLVETTIADRASYDRGVAEERSRIARDLHDEVGATLLSGLHAADPDRRHECIVDALSDIRQIASGLAGRDVTLSSLIAQMRHESRIRAELHGFSLSWPLDPAADDSEIVLPYTLHRNFHAIHREALSNALAHGVPGEIAVRSALAGGRLTHSVSNARAPAGKPAAEPGLRHHGSANMQARARALGGKLAVDDGGGIHSVRLEFPVTEPPP